MFAVTTGASEVHDVMTESASASILDEEMLMIPFFVLSLPRVFKAIYYHEKFKDFRIKSYAALIFSSTDEILLCLNLFISKS